MASQTETPAAVSCPAKVLVAGGYLVLDRRYTGLVFGLDARIHTIVQPIRTRPGVSISDIVVKSPQFHGAIWEYGYRAVGGTGTGVVVTQLSIGHEQSISASKNPFIETALSYALSYIWALQPSSHIPPSTIYILADEAYYSNPGKPRPSSSSPFLDFNVSLKDAHKTGLGSSAALVTSFTAAVLSFHLTKDVFDLESESGQTILHNLAQASHSHAQGKVGSGFDIASAVYGSCLYKRFSPTLLSGLPYPKDRQFGAKLRELIEGEAWDTDIRKAAIKMPKRLRLVMCDVDCGSETPGMVKQVLKWREDNRDEADRIWGALQNGNEKLAEELTRLAAEESDAAHGRQPYEKLRTIIEANRELIRRMGVVSGVPIEPPQQTKLLDYCSSLDGVVGGVVPGAGGFDAIVLLVEDDEKVLSSLQKALKAYEAGEQEDEAVKIGKVGIIGVREEMVGVRREDFSLYRDWIVTSQ